MCALHVRPDNVCCFGNLLTSKTNLKNMSKYKVGDTVCLLHDTETGSIVKEIINRTLPVQDGANNNKLVAVVKMAYYHIKDKDGNITTVEEGFLR